MYQNRPLIQPTALLLFELVNDGKLLTPCRKLPIIYCFNNRIDPIATLPHNVWTLVVKKMFFIIRRKWWLFVKYYAFVCLYVKEEQFSYPIHLYTVNKQQNIQMLLICWTNAIIGETFTSNPNRCWLKTMFLYIWKSPRFRAVVAIWACACTQGT